MRCGHGSAHCIDGRKGDGIRDELSDCSDRRPRQHLRLCGAGRAAAEQIRTLAENGYGVIFLTEQLAGQIPDVLDAYAHRTLPALIPIPGVSGNTGIGMRNVHRAVERAVGSDLLANS